MTEPTRRADDPALARDRADEERADESRDISDVGLPHGDDAGDVPTGDVPTGDAATDEAALDEVFPPEDA